MRRELTEIIRDIRRQAKYILIKLMLFALRPVEPKDDFEGELNSIIILAQEKIGDAILLTPLLKNLKRHFPGIEIHVVALSPVYPFYENDPNVDVVHKVKQNYFAYFKAIRKKKFDLLFSTKDHPSFTFLYQSRIIPARYRVSIHHEYHNGFFHHLIQLDFHRHIIEKNCALLDFLNIKYRQEDCRPYLPLKDVSEGVREFAKKISNDEFIGINLSAGEADREWSLSKWAEFIRQAKYRFIIFSTKNRDLEKQQLQSMFENVLEAPVTRNIFEAGAIIRQLKLLVTPDTALIHVASCFNVPVVGLYRSHVIHVTRFYPYLTPNEVLMSPTDRIEDINIGDTIKAVRIMLDKQNKSTVYQKA